jgi:hypothetical protein
MEESTVKGIEKICKNGELVAIVFRKNLRVKEREFFTEDNNPFQVGAHNRKKGIKLTPHVHNLKKPIIINALQEWLLVTKGKILVTLYTDRGKIIDQKALSKGDSILLMEQGHGVDFLEDSQIFEIKQGPFINTVHSKIFLK